MLRPSCGVFVCLAAISPLVTSPAYAADNVRTVVSTAPISTTPISTTPISVKNFGAKGDGIADDTAAIEASINASLVTSEHPCVTFPAGIYKVTTTIQLAARGICLQGTTPWNTFLDS